MPYVLPVSLPWARVGNAYAWMTGTEAREVALKRAHLGLLTELKLYTDKIDAIQRVGDGLECVGCAVPPSRDVYQRVSYLTLPVDSRQVGSSRRNLG